VHFIGNHVTKFRGNKLLISPNKIQHIKVLRCAYMWKNTIFCRVQKGGRETEKDSKRDIFGKGDSVQDNCTFVSKFSEFSRDLPSAFSIPHQGQFHLIVEGLFLIGPFAVTAMVSPILPFSRTAQ